MGIDTVSFFDFCFFASCSPVFPGILKTMSGFLKRFKSGSPKPKLPGGIKQVNKTKKTAFSPTLTKQSKTISTKLNTTQGDTTQGNTTQGEIKTSTSSSTPSSTTSATTSSSTPSSTSSATTSKKTRTLSQIEQTLLTKQRIGSPASHWSNTVLRAGIEGEVPIPTLQPGELMQLRKFETILQQTNVDLETLRKIAWNGCPAVSRPLVWQLLLGYLPSNTSRRTNMLIRKRKEYNTNVREYWEIDESQRTTSDDQVLRQILKDLPRTHPDIPLFSTSQVQKALGRILYIWAIKHPASGYVQGMNDLATPLYLVFLGAFVDSPRSCDVGRISSDVLSAVEADTFWCLTKLLDGIQDHYTPSQPGLQRMVHRLELLMKRIDKKLYDHLINENITFMQFAFRWMNCLLMRELELNCIVRLWDTYLSESSRGFDDFHVYVCASFLTKFSSKLITMEFQELIMFIQSPPTANWELRDVGELVSMAFVYQSQYAGSKW